MSTTESSIAAEPVETPNPGPIVNIAAYKFVTFQEQELPELREQLRALCAEQDLKGTILLTPEGINCFMAGTRQQVEALLAFLRRDERLAGLEVKESFSDYQPFARLLIKIKQEIIAFGQPGIDPANRTSPKLPAKQLHEWLAAGKKVHLYDTRNDYEIECGTFEGAVAAKVDHFRDFPEAIKQLPEEWKDEPVVMFCTGGIRCEKAGPFMEQAGFKEIYQLEGGILKYFEECGGDFYDGDCFVFDKRVALNPQLEETETTQCYVCQSVVLAEDQKSDQYEFGVSCPRCYLSPEQSLKRRSDQLQEIAAQQPGCESYDQKRPLSIPLRYDGWNLLDCLTDWHQHYSREEWQNVIEAGDVLFEGEAVTSDRSIRSGEQFIRVNRDCKEPEVATQIETVCDDTRLLVLNKPAPLPIHPCGRYYKNTLQHFLITAFNGQKIRPAHRLDANTTGLVVFSKSRETANRIQPLFERGEVEKVYLARVAGTVSQNKWTINTPIAKQASEAGGRELDSDGQTALTECQLVHQYEDGTSLLEVHPHTGRTNQIRVHLWSCGLPIVGDPVYLPDGQKGDQQTLSVNDPPMCLHAWKLKFADPCIGGEREFETALPAWVENAIP